MKANHPLSLTLVTNKANQPLNSYLEFVEECLRAGVTSVQLREKSLPYTQLLEFGTALKSLSNAYNAPLIINDHPRLCLELDAAGVHLGQSDQDIKSTRKLLGNKLIGLSVNTIEQVLDSNSLPVDYIGVGTIFETSSKKDIETKWGLDGLKNVSAIASHPIIAIGGINQENAADVIYSGASGIALIAALHNSNSPALTTRRLANIIQEAQK